MCMAVSAWAAPLNLESGSYRQGGTSLPNQDLATPYLTRSGLLGAGKYLFVPRMRMSPRLTQFSSDPSASDAWQSRNLLRRACIAGTKNKNALKAYQQLGVCRDGRNPTFWCSTGALYFQYCDAPDAYSCAIRVNPHISSTMDLCTRAATIRPTGLSTPMPSNWDRPSNAAIT